ncbi:AAA family ATPase [Pseudonocardia sp. Cha107L01]|uniref:AAA family ATPase n=1 Tax=Pseudonocardia sp. Cha107L01 TaxID=3457576 RepID=UPI00403E5E5C
MVVPRSRWTAAELMGITFPPPKWAIAGLVSEGLTLLAGAPKLGKSWLVLDWAIAVARGDKVLGGIDVEQGDVLYLALEDTGRRLQNRVRKLLAGSDAPARLTLETRSAALPNGGSDGIRDWLDIHPEARLIVIDTFAKVRGFARQGQSAYDADYAAVCVAKRIADDYGVAVILVHHVRKMSAEDFLEAVSGTNGIAGAADAVLVLKRSRGEADGSLDVTGRDIDERQYALTFNSETGQWSALPGEAIDHLIGDTRAAILRHLREHPSQGPKPIAAATGLAYELVKKTCVRMAEDGQIVNDGRGHYKTVPGVPAVPTAGQGPAGVSPGVSPDAATVPVTADRDLWLISGESA